MECGNLGRVFLEIGGEGIKPFGTCGDKGSVGPALAQDDMGHGQEDVDVGARRRLSHKVAWSTSGTRRGSIITRLAPLLTARTTS